jgi:RNase P/RNase MRP subunit p30
MAERKQDLFSKLADRGEEVVGRITDMPGAQRVLENLGGLKERVDDLQRKVRGLDELEKRVAALERKVDALSRPATTARRTTAKRTTARAAAKPKPKPKSP